MFCVAGFDAPRLHDIDKPRQAADNNAISGHRRYVAHMTCSISARAAPAAFIFTSQPPIDRPSSARSFAGRAHFTRRATIDARHRYDIARPP